jgi:prepilin-type N-terminal cleavage/methylation domain-containing protein
MRTLRFPHPLPAARNSSRDGGFSVLEVLVAITVLAIGLTAMASLVAQTLGGTERSRYMSLASTLTSEKLEDLNRWPAADPHVAVPTGWTSEGSLTSDASNGTINYYDDIDLSNTTGQVSETIASTSGTTTTYSSVIHNSTGYVQSSATSAAPSGSGIISFHRRWLIEADPVVNGVTLTGIRRVTVSVSLTNNAIRPPVGFQLSLVRP